MITNHLTPSEIKLKILNQTINFTPSHQHNVYPLSLVTIPLCLFGLKHLLRLVSKIKIQFLKFFKTIFLLK